MDRIDRAFRVVRREDFLPSEAKNHAAIDAAIAIGFGQTNSQPSTVRMMLEWLDAGEGQKVLDVGSGSGWTTALLAYIVGPKGKVYAVEKVPQLVEFGRENAWRAGIKNAQFFEAGKDLGLDEHAPYDKILVSASAHVFPESLLEQLKPGGKLVVPVENTIYEVTKQKSDNYSIEKHHGFIFVPLI